MFLRFLVHMSSIVVDIRIDLDGFILLTVWCWSSTLDGARRVYLLVPTLKGGYVVADLPVLGTVLHEDADVLTSACFCMRQSFSRADPWRWN